jgi:hypothetical protein
MAGDGVAPFGWKKLLVGRPFEICRVTPATKRGI